MNIVLPTSTSGANHVKKAEKVSLENGPDSTNWGTGQCQSYWYPLPVLDVLVASGTLELKNRIIVTAVGLSLANEDGTVSDRLLNYHVG